VGERNQRDGRNARLRAEPGPRIPSPGGCWCRSLQCRRGARTPLVSGRQANRRFPRLQPRPMDQPPDRPVTDHPPTSSVTGRFVMGARWAQRALHTTNADPRTSQRGRLRDRERSPSGVPMKTATRPPARSRW
jgi:hypothetical protein